MSHGQASPVARHLLAWRCLWRSLPLLWSDHPQTSLRVLCIAAFEYLACARGGTLDVRARRTLAVGCDLGAVANDHYDQGVFDRRAWRGLRRTLGHLAPWSGTARYLRGLRVLERSRPVASPGPDGFADQDAVVRYRSGVVALSLEWLWGLIPGPRPSTDLSHGARGSDARAAEEARGATCSSPGETTARGTDGRAVLAPQGATCSTSGDSALRDGEAHAAVAGLAPLVQLVQLVDDLLDWRDDLAGRRPTYVTAFVLGPPPSRDDARGSVRALADRFWREARAHKDGIFGPMLVSAWMAWLLARALIVVRLPSW